MKLFDRLIDHVVDRVMARAELKRPKGPTFVTNINGAARAGKQSADEYERAMRAGVNAATTEGLRLAKRIADGIAGEPPAAGTGRTA